jgi:hypothetical protein
MAAIYPKKRISDRSRYLWYDMGSRKNISKGGVYDG